VVGGSGKVELEPQQDGNGAQKWFFGTGQCNIFTNYLVPGGGPSLCMSTNGEGANENVWVSNYPPPSGTWSNWSDTGLAGGAP
jgi:hypothetical protein